MEVTAWSFHVRNTIMLDRSSKNSSPSVSPTGDPLTDILRGLRLDGVQYGRCEMKEPWGLEFPAQDAARFYFVGQKACWMRMPNGDWFEMKAGDAVLVPRGAPHALASSPDVPTTQFKGYEITEICKNVYCMRTETEAESCVPGTLLFCGTMYFNLDSLHPLLGMMPDVMRTHGLEEHEPSIPHLLEAMAREIKMERVGSAGIVARLADVLAASIIRSWVERGCGDSKGWIAAVRDRELGKVLAAIHLEPNRDWSVETLARSMGASRSGFAERFASTVGETPARYVTQVRMHQARQWLTHDRLRIAVVANRLGYESEAAFSRAFKRVIGAPPSHFRGEDHIEVPNI
jgi:AraC-like DNA-binding protein